MNANESHKTRWSLTTFVLLAALIFSVFAYRSFGSLRYHDEHSGREPASLPSRVRREVEPAPLDRPGMAGLAVRVAIEWGAGTTKGRWRIRAAYGPEPRMRAPVAYDAGARRVAAGSTSST